MKKIVYLDANTLYQDSFRLARKIWDSGFKPNFIIGVWRGGTPPGIVIHEFLRVKYKQNGMRDPYHTAIKTQSYNGLMSGSGSYDVVVKGFEHVIDVINSEDNLLIVDDVWDNGYTIQKVLEEIKAKARKNTPKIKVAVVYWKKERSKVPSKPDYYGKIINDWINFPHELDGLTAEEIKEKSEEIYKLIFE